MNLKNNVFWDLAKFDTFLFVITVVSLGGDQHRKNREYGAAHLSTGSNSKDSNKIHISPRKPMAPAPVKAVALE